MNLEELQSNLNINFTKINLLETAITHKSFYVNKKIEIQKYNQRLEFLGDSVLDLIITEYLFLKYPDDNEGILTSKRSLLVDEASLSSIAKELKLDECLRMSKEELNRGGNLRDSALADAMEALIGAIFIDKGYEYVEEFILNLFKNPLENINNLQNYKDSKSLLQEMVQAESLEPPKYILDKVSGPSHNPIFMTDVYINNKKISSAKGNKKIISEQNAAEMAIKYIDKNNFNDIKAKKSFFKKVLSSFR